MWPTSIRISPFRWTGEVTEVVGLLIEIARPSAAVGDFCEVTTSGGRPIRTQLIGFRNGRVLAYRSRKSKACNWATCGRSADARVNVGPGLLGRVVDGFGKPMDGGPIEAHDAYSLYGTPTNSLEREHITQPLVTGIRAIDGLLPCGKGRKRPAHRNFRRQRCLQEYTAGLHVAAQLGRRDRDRHDWETQSRSARVSRERTWS